MPHKGSKTLFNHRNTPRLPAMPPVCVQRTSMNRRQVFSDQYLLRSLPVKSILISEITEGEENKDHCFWKNKNAFDHACSSFNPFKRNPCQIRESFLTSFPIHQDDNWLQSSVMASSTIFLSEFKSPLSFYRTTSITINSLAALLEYFSLLLPW